MGSRRSVLLRLLQPSEVQSTGRREHGLSPLGQGFFDCLLAGTSRFWSALRLRHAVHELSLKFPGVRGDFLLESERSLLGLLFQNDVNVVVYPVCFQYLLCCEHLREICLQGDRELGLSAVVVNEILLEFCPD